MARRSGGNPGAVVAVLTALAFAAVAFLALQASAADDRPSASKKPGATPSAKDKQDAKKTVKPPADSGVGERVVYALQDDRVWLIGARDRVRRSYTVWPGSVDPEPGQYRVSSRAAHATGTDGVQVENIVRFAVVDGTSIGFSSAVDGSEPDLEPGEKAGGIRQKRADGKELWLFAPVGAKIVVIP